MGDINLEVWDATGNKKQLVEVPADAPINRVIAVLVERMNLPRQSPDGQLMSYKFHHRRSGRQLLDTQTLFTAEVRDGDILRLQPEITAGVLLPILASGGCQPPGTRLTQHRGVDTPRSPNAGGPDNAGIASTPHPRTGHGRV